MAETLTVQAGGCFDCIAARTAPEKAAGLSSEHSNLIAALMFPSSTFEVTARDRSNVLPFHFSEPRFLSAGGAVPAILSLMHLVMLSRSPVLGGLIRKSGAKFNNFFQGVKSLTFCTMLLRMAVNAEQQAGRADRGMCFRTGPAGLG